MAITNIEGGDFVDQGRDKVNDAFGEIPVSFEPTSDGNLLITKHNGGVITVPLKNFFSLLGQVAQLTGATMATPDQAGKVKLVDPDDPTQSTSVTRVYTAAQITDLLKTVPKIDLESATTDQLVVVHPLADGTFALLVGPRLDYDLGGAFVGTLYPDFTNNFDPTNFFAVL